MTTLSVCTAAERKMSRPAVRIANDSVSESVDLLQMLITPPPPPPPSTGRPVPSSRHVEDSTSSQGPRSDQQLCYQSCHACAAEYRYRQQQQPQPQQPGCAYCVCSQPRPQRCDHRDDIYFNPRRPPPPSTGCTWPVRPTTVKLQGTSTSAARDDGSGSARAGLASGSSTRDDDVDDYDDAAGKRTMSTSLSSRSSLRTARLRTAADICRQARRAAAVTECCLRCWPRRRADADTAAAASCDPLQRSTLTDIDVCVQAPRPDPAASAATPAGKLKPSLRRGLRSTASWDINTDRRRTILLVIGFLVGLFLVSTALLTGFVLLWPAHRRRHSGITPKLKKNWKK